jgi:hypothetical protein
VEERDVGQVIRAIKAHALMHREHRDRDQDGQIVANVVDYILVSELMNDILAEGSGLAVSPAVAKTTEAVIEATAEMNTDEGATAQAIGKILKLDKSAARRRLVKAANEGFVVNLETRKGQPGRYRATGQAVEGALLLPQPKVLFASQSPANPQEPAQPCHRDEKADDFQDDDGGKPPLPAVADTTTVATTDTPVAADLATDKPLNCTEKGAPVARCHDVSEPAEAVGTDVLPDSLKRCAQCNAGGDELEPQRDGDRLVWLHPECARFWKETQTYD